MTFPRRRVLTACAAGLAGLVVWFKLRPQGHPQAVGKQQTGSPVQAAGTNHPDRKAIIRAVFSAPADSLKPTMHHVKLLRQLRAIWVPEESGAPGIDAAQPLLGTSAALPAAMSILETPHEAVAIRTLAEMGLLASLYCASGKLPAPGPYELPGQLRKAFRDPARGVDSRGIFRLRPEHLLLLRSAHWRVVNAASIDEVLAEGADLWPMPYVDGKRPYGNFTYYQLEMAERLGEPYARAPDGKALPDRAKDARLEGLHLETLAALQVAILNAPDDAFSL